MSRYLIFLLALNIQGFASIAYASNDLDKWNSEKGKVIRSELKSKLTTTYKEKSNPLHTDSTYKASENSGKVLTKLETKGQINGSRVGATIEALKQVDKTAVAKKWAKEFAKGGVRFAAGAVLIEVAMNEMLNGIGWIIDEGGKVKYSPDNPKAPTLDKNTSPYLYQASDEDGNLVTVYDINAHCSSLKYDDYNNGINTYTWVFDSSSTAYPSTSCVYKRYINGSYSPPNSGRAFQRYKNPDYKGPSVGSASPTQSDMESDIKDYLNDPTKPNSVKDAIIQEAVKPTGKASIMWSDDPSSEQTIFQDNKDSAERILNSDNPQGEGLTKTTPKIDDGTTVDADTTPKPNPETPYKTDPTTGQPVLDPTTGQPVPNPNYNPDADTGSTTSFSLPAFCSWASVVCDWLDWTKEMPEDEEQKEEENINDRGIFNRELDTDFNLEGSCPPDFTFQMTNKYFAGSYTIPLNWLCISFTFIGYALIFLSNCIGMWILYETVTRKELRF